MKRLRITAYGRVQRVGYRDAVAEIARKLNLKGTVKNLEDEVSVDIIAEGEEKQLQEFVKLIQIKDYAVDVEKLDVEEEKPTGEFKHFKIIRGDGFEELGERIDVAGKLLYKSLEKQDSMLSKQDSMLEKQDTSLEKQDSMLEKQDTSLEKQDSMLSKQDSMLVKQDATISEIRGMKNETSSQFGHLDMKYHTVSENLKNIDAHLKELVDILKAFKPKE